MREKVVVFFGFISVDAGFGPYLVRTAQRGLLDVAKDLLFVANTRGCGTELLRHAHLRLQKTKPRHIAAGFGSTTRSCGTELLRQAKLHRTRHRAAVPLKGSWAEC